MGVFITVKVDAAKCEKGCTICAETCPVKIFILGEGSIAVDPAAVDECILCNICLDGCPVGAIEIIKNY